MIGITYNKVTYKKNPINILTKKSTNYYYIGKIKIIFQIVRIKRYHVDNLSRAYALPKMHKSNCPFRIIISSIDSSLYSLASFLRISFYIISEKSSKSFSKIENSFILHRN